jgi:TolB-like protein/Tfp pilus assembly protein PilF
MSLYHELKRRNVFRVGIAYLALAWLLTEVSGTLFPAFGIPDWGVRFVVIVFALGFVPAVIISWVYELTPEGIKREKDVVRDASITHQTAKRLDVFTIGLIVVALAFILADWFWMSPRLAEQSAAPAAAVIDTIQTQGPEPAEPQYPPNSIAVLPFANRSANPDDAYFVDGIHDDLLTHISKIGAIRTISRTSVMQYRGSSKSIPEIAAELGVATVLEGGVQRAGDQIRINVQLIDARTDEHLWAEIYDRQLLTTNIFAIQSEIAEAIAEALRMTLSPREQQRIRSVPTESLAAYEAYLIGKQRLAKRTTQSLAEAEEYFRRAVELDPEYALAWVGLADTHMLQVWLSGLPERENFDKAKAAIDMALELDSDLGEAYASLGLLKGGMKDLEGAEQAYKQALELSPNYAPGHQWFSGLLAELGRWEERLIRMETAIQLDPMSTVIRYAYAVSLREVGRFEEALEQLEIALEIDPNFVSAHDAIATIQWQVFNRFDMAAQGFVKAITLDPKRADLYVWLAQLYLDLGEPERASLLLDRANELAPDYNTTAWGRLLLHLYQQTTGDWAEDAEAVLAEPIGTPWLSHFCAAQLRNQAMAEGRHDEALAIYSKHHPQLLLDVEPVIDLNNYRAAIDLSLVLQMMGDQERASMLLERSAAFIRGQPRLGMFGGYWISDVQILALQGQKAEALAALRLAADEGWRSLWWYFLQYDPNLESIRSEPVFQAILAEIKADMSAQMQRIREMEQSGEIETVPGVIFEPK